MPIRIFETLTLFVIRWLQVKARIYHNPQCSHSRAALALLQAHGIEVEIIEYLKDPPSKATLKALLAKLEGAASEFVRTKEPEYKTLTAERTLDDDALLGLLAEHPRLLQRPIVEIGERARIGRPALNVLELMQ